MDSASYIHAYVDMCIYAYISITVINTRSWIWKENMERVKGGGKNDVDIEVIHKILKNK